MPKVSIGLPVYNAENFIREAIDSILAQTFTDFELVISDNASTDATEAICRAYAAADARVRYCRNTVNIGAGKNYNRVFELSTGTYFKWAAHDDVCAPDFIKECVEALDRDPSLVLAFPKMIDIDENGKPLETQYSDAIPRAERASSLKPHLRFRYLIRLGYTCEEVFGVIRTDILRRTSLILNYTDSDRTLLAELGLYGKFYEVPKVLFYHRVHRGMSTQAFTDWHARTAWFDPAKAGKVVFPLWRQGVEYGKAILRVPVSLNEKAWCLLYMANWTRRHRAHLWGELSRGLKQWFHNDPGK